MSNHTEYDPEEVKLFIKDFAATNLHNSTLSPTSRYCNLRIIGKHGIGKSEIVAQVALENKIPFAKRALPEMDELTALQGYPIKLYTVYKKDENGDIINSVQVEKDLMNLYLENGYTVKNGSVTTSNAEPDWVKEIKRQAELPGYSKGFIMFFDEPNRALSHIKSAVMELLNTGSYGGWSLPRGGIFILGENPDGGKYNTNASDQAQLDRASNLYMKFSAPAWCKWAEASPLIREEFINFIYNNPEVEKKTSIRKWTEFFEQINTGFNLEDPKDIERIYTKGTIIVGPTSIGTFINFIKDNLNIIPSVQWIIEHSDHNEVLALLKECTLDPDTGQPRHDIKGLLGMRINNYASTKADLTPIHVNRLVKILLTDTLPIDTIIMMFSNFSNPDNKNYKLLSQIFNDTDLANKVLDLQIN